jgi:hypothetical protein
VHFMLMGAGFSRNWGGWLADEVFDYLLGSPEIRRSPDLRRLLWRFRERGGFESVLGEAQRNYNRDPVSSQDLLGLQAAIASMFGQMNSGYLDAATWEWGTDVQRSVTGFLARFDALFTLNQDLLLEQHYAPEGRSGPPGRLWQGLNLPGMVPWAGVGDPRARGLARRNWSAGDQAGFTETDEMQPLYKLHGSAAWSDRINPNLMIMGDNKGREIGMFPILNWYFEQFERKLNTGGAKLLVIGYGFRDTHVNEIIESAIRASGLQLYVIDPQGAGIAREIRRRNEGPIAGGATPLEQAFEAGLIGASRRSLREMFSHDSIELAKLLRFFDPA